MKQHTDGELAPAKTRLNQAITKLFDPVGQNIGGHWREAPSYFDQLCDAIHGQTGERSGGAAGSPLWPDALDIRNTIDNRLAQWCNGRGYTSMDRVCLLDARAWRPMDTILIDTIATEMEAWRLTIIALLYPEPKISLPNPCPQCTQQWAYRNSDGERIRTPALHIDSQGCHCLNCKTRWTPDYFAHLARVLGYETPEGVLE